jgi:hypothetical protein
MRYKVVNLLFRDETGETLTIEAVFDDFEGVIKKIVADLNSLWKGTVPLPMAFRIEEHKESWNGMRFLNGDMVVADSPNFDLDLLQVWGTEMQKLIKTDKAPVVTEEHRLNYLVNKLKGVDKE